jgi:hypothetical protein
VDQAGAVSQYGLLPVCIEAASDTLAPMRTKKKSPPRPKLTAAQIEMVGQFNDYGHENPKLNFEQTAKKELGPKAFPNTPNGRKFRTECKAAFDAERQ